MYVLSIRYHLSAIYIFTLILLPVALKRSYDIITFGIVMCTNLVIGLITPPVGVSQFTACSISKTSIKELSGDVIPIPLGLLLYLRWSLTCPPSAWACQPPGRTVDDNRDESRAVDAKSESETTQKKKNVREYNK